MNGRVTSENQNQRDFYSQTLQDIFVEMGEKVNRSDELRDEIKKLGGKAGEKWKEFVWSQVQKLEFHAEIDHKVENSRHRFELFLKSVGIPSEIQEVKRKIDSLPSKIKNKVRSGRVYLSKTVYVDLNKNDLTIHSHHEKDPTAEVLRFVQENDISIINKNKTSYL